MEITHNEAAKAALLLRMYCEARFNKELGERGCKECIFSAGERVKRCVLTPYLEGITDTAEKEVNKNYERISRRDLRKTND